MSSIFFSEDVKEAVYKRICEELDYQRKIRDDKLKLHKLTSRIREQLNILDDKLAYSEALTERLQADLEEMEDDK